MSKLVRMIEDIFDINWNLTICGQRMKLFFDISSACIKKCHLEGSLARIICNPVEKQIVFLCLLKLIP